MSSIPLAGLSAQHEAVAGEVADGWQEVLGSTAFVGGAQIWKASHRAAADRYHLLLSGMDEVITPRTLPGDEHVWQVRVAGALKSAFR